METELPSFSRLDPLVDRFMGDGLSFKSWRWMGLEPSGDHIRALSPFKLRDHVSAQGFIKVELSLPVLPSCPASVGFFLGNHGGIGPISGAIPSDLP